MGQRLVISIYKTKKDQEKENCFSKIYYHWSAYTATAVAEVWDLMKDYPKNETLSDSQLATYLVQQLEKRGGGLDPKDAPYYTELTNDTNYSKNVHRSNGLIAFSKNNQNELQYWSEGDVFIYLDKLKFNSAIGFPIFDLKDYCENYDLDYEETKKYITSKALKFDIDKDHSIDQASDIFEKLNGVEFVITSDDIIFECVR